MTGVSHIQTNIATAVGFMAMDIIIRTGLTAIGWSAGSIDSILFLHPLFLAPQSELHIAIPYYIVGFICFLFGTLLPDIDSKNSIMGKVLHVPIEHRTWTHTIWAVLPWMFAAWLVPVMVYLVAGYLGHILWDSASKMGVCWLYPFSKYRYFGTSGAKIKDGHRYYLYETGKGTEKGVVLVAWVIVALLYCCAILMRV